MKEFAQKAITAIRENARATVVERPFTSGALVLTGVAGTLLLQWLL